MNRLVQASFPYCSVACGALFLFAGGYFFVALDTKAALAALCQHGDVLERVFAHVTSAF